MAYLIIAPFTFLLMGASYEEPIDLLERQIFRAEELFEQEKEDEAIQELEGVFQALIPHLESQAEDEKALDQIFSLMNRVAQLELSLAKEYLSGKKRRGPFGLRIFSGKSVASEMLIRLREYLPESEAAMQAAWTLANYYERKEDWKQAEFAFAEFAESYPESEYREEALRKAIQFAQQQYNGPAYDATSLKRALNYFRIYEREFPQEAQMHFEGRELRASIREELAEKMLKTAKWYLRTGDRPSFEFYRRRLVVKYPETEAAKVIQEIE